MPRSDNWQDEDLLEARSGDAFEMRVHFFDCENFEDH